MQNALDEIIEAGLDDEPFDQEWADDILNDMIDVWCRAHEDRAELRVSPKARYKLELHSLENEVYRCLLWSDLAGPALDAACIAAETERPGSSRQILLDVHDAASRSFWGYLGPDWTRPNCPPELDDTAFEDDEDDTRFEANRKRRIAAANEFVAAHLRGEKVPSPPSPPPRLPDAQAAITGHSPAYGMDKALFASPVDAKGSLGDTIFIDSLDDMPVPPPGQTVAWRVRVNERVVQ